MATKKPLTNAQIVAKLMETSSFGALAQIFIMDALGKGIDRVANTDIEELREAFGPNSMIHPDAWHGVAQELQARLVELRKN